VLRGFMFLSGSGLPTRHTVVGQSIDMQTKSISQGIDLHLGGGSKTEHHRADAKNQRESVKFIQGDEN
jgi:hypothetical protein